MKTIYVKDIAPSETYDLGPTTFNNRTIKRLPDEFEAIVLEYIKANPGRIIDEIAGVFKNSQKAYDAIVFLWLNDYAERDPLGRITAR